MKKDLKIGLGIVSIAVLLLIAACVFALRWIETEHRRNVSAHVVATLETVSRLINVLRADESARVSVIAQDPKHIDMAERLMREPGNKALAAEFDRWITPLYQSRGFDGYSLIRTDNLIVTASSPAYVGQKTASVATDEALRKAHSNGVEVTRPISAPRPVTTQGQVLPRGTAFQLVCARVMQEQRVLGFLCLRTDPRLRLFQVLEAGRIGKSGETYVIDAAARMLSPSRFEDSLPMAAKQQPGWSAFRLHARVPQSESPTGRVSRPLLPGEHDPMTLMASRLVELKAGTTGYLENYSDYRARPVIGAGRWLPEMNMGLIVEEDVAEAFRPYHFARNAVVSMTVVSILLILVLSVMELRSRRSLAGSEQRFRAFTQNTPVGMQLKSPRGAYVMTNPVFERVFGLTNERVIGKTDFELMPFELARERSAEHEQVLDTQRPLSRTYTTRKSDGSELTFQLLRFPVYGYDDSSIAGVGTVAMDITEQIRTQRELEELARTLESKVEARTSELSEARVEAESAARAKAEFLANMSHEIRTPLNAIIGMSHLAARLQCEPRLRGYLDRIRASSRHLLAIVNDILDFSKIEAGKLPVEAESFSLERLLDHVAGLVWERAEAKGLELIVIVDPDVPDLLVGDSLHIGQVLINFANNAVKFTEHGEVILQVSVVAREGDQIQVRLAVEDTGIGIAAEDIPELFQPFHQVDASIARRFEGTGLGLIISRKLAELMGGNVSVTSLRGKGSVFALQVPLRVGVQAAPASIVPSIDARDRRVLVVDDNDAARRILVDMLRSLAFRVDDAVSGQAAVDMVATADAIGNPYDLVFIDARMPGLSGRGTAQQMRMLSLGSAAPRLLLVARDAEIEQASADAPLFAARVSKPVSPSNLFDTLMDVLSGTSTRSLQREAPRTEADYPGLQGRRVLLVEDNLTNQEVARDLLEMVGMQVEIAGDGLQALQMLHGNRYDIVLMDVHMPVMSGMEAARLIRRETQFVSLPIVALTANVLGGDRERCLEVGMNDYVAKPIDPDRLFGTLERFFPGPPMARADGGEPQQVAAQNDALKPFRDIPGLDVELGLSRFMGREDLYLKLVQRVATERGDLPATLMSAARAGRFEEAADSAHSLKSIVGMMGATSLQHCTAAIELAAQRAAIPQDLLEVFERDSANLWQALQGALAVQA